jgi:hypothetical protein
MTNGDTVAAISAARCRHAASVGFLIEIHGTVIVGDVVTMLRAIILRDAQR